MTKYNYALEKKDELAVAVGRDLQISTKHSIEICNYIRGKKLARVIKFLENVIEEKEAVPFKRFNMDVGHRPGIGSGRFPKNAAEAILKIVKSAQSNAKFKNMDENLLVLVHVLSQKASTPMRSGRQGRRETKRTHIEVALKEVEKKETKKPAKKEATKTTVKAKPAVEKKEAKVEDKND
ncbi:50S ribosomal protein L22 [Candidatus Woesearchaeota archaeon]|nr:50S ribosomal protein L22 [Candidatus Woesearchaeota archaeon]